ncbi:MAG: YkgJ family cysteine cluster protein [Synergistaceae bacterium]|nr:YkgJ family cysteine cluster protein [Synergistaceae bacterium]
MIGGIPALQHLDNGNGVCVHLHDNLCTIYESRPMICNTSQMYNAFFKSIMTPEEFIDMNLQACRKIQELNRNNMR